MSAGLRPNQGRTSLSELFQTTLFARVGTGVLHAPTNRREDRAKDLSPPRHRTGFPVRVIRDIFNLAQESNFVTS